MASKRFHLPPHHSDSNPTEMTWSAQNGMTHSSTLTFKLLETTEICKKLNHMTDDDWKPFYEKVK
jgi:hypothetical protein